MRPKKEKGLKKSKIMYFIVVGFELGTFLTKMNPLCHWTKDFLCFRWGQIFKLYGILQNTDHIYVYI